MENAIEISELKFPFHQPNLIVSKETTQKYIDQYSVINRIFSGGTSVPYLLDLTTLKYTFMCESIINIFGLPASDLIDGGIRKLFRNIHPEDRSIIHNNVLPQFRKVIQSNPHQTKKLIFTYNYRFNHHERGYISCIDRVMILESDSEENPLLFFGLITDVSHHVKGNSIIATVSVLNKAHEYKPIYTENFQHNSTNIFTSREMDIIQLLSKGLSSKGIAEKLFISSKTVDKHRRNMIRKSSTKNTRELVHYCLQQGWVL